MNPSYGTLLRFALVHLAALTPVLRAQQCGTDLTPEAHAIMLARQSAGIYDPPPGERFVFMVPITFHVLHADDGSGGATPQMLAWAMANANSKFLEMGMQFFQQGATDHINNSALFNGTTQQNLTAHLHELRNTNVVANTINVYYVDQLPGLCGMSTFSSDADQGIVMSCWEPLGVDFILAHEIGHYFDLLHTHEGSSCPDGSDCATTGDFVCDTPADPGLGLPNMVSNCTYIGTAQAPCGLPYQPDPTNIMSYAPKPCLTHFTAGQQARAYATLMNVPIRRALIANSTAMTAYTWVNLAGATPPYLGTFDQPMPTLPQAILVTPINGRIVFKNGGSSHNPITLSQPVTLDSFRGTVTIGN